jgi:Sortase domain
LDLSTILYCDIIISIQIHETMKTKTPPKYRKTNVFLHIWKLRYRIYAIIVIMLLPALLFAADANTKDSIPVDAGYRIVKSELLADQVAKVDTKTLAKAETPKSVEEKKEEKYIPDIKNAVVIKDGKISAFAEDGSDISKYYTNSALYQQYIKGSDNNGKPRQALEEIVKKPEQGIKNSYLIYPKYRVQAPIQYGDFKDLFQTRPEGGFNFNGELIDQNPIEAPIQQKLKDGIVHLGYTVQPGDVGNSYIVGHSSNFGSVKSDYNTIFKPLESKTEVGEDFMIYDRYGRELKFCVFEALKIEEADITTAYKEFPGERVVTLQTSILGWKNGQLQATHRWLTRGKMCNETSKTASSQAVEKKIVEDTPATEPKTEQENN